MLRRAFLVSALLTGTAESAFAHTIGLAEQVLQPVSTVHALLPVLATGLVLRQRRSRLLPGASPVPQPLVMALAIGLCSGLLVRHWMAAASGLPAAALVVAVVAGLVAAVGQPLPAWAKAIVTGALGFALGANLHTETDSGLELAQCLTGAFIGTVVVLHVLLSLPYPAGRQWQAVGERIIGSWSLALATIMLALSARGLT